MADEIKSNLEPVSESGLGLESKVSIGREEKEGEVQKIEKEVPKEVSVAEKDSAYTKILSKVQKTSDEEGIGKSDVGADAKSVYEAVDAESQIQNLVDLAMNKDVIHAVKVARHLDDNYVLDMFHDKLLADELHDALISKGIIKKS
ncbi:hypothetical protein ACFL08_04285 [Patescibacteria group bacterium]